jgi:RNase adapter protein RapZ
MVPASSHSTTGTVIQCYNHFVTDYPQSVVIITGMSGAGKSTALRCFEDMGYFCVDNVPPQVMETLLMLLGQSGAHGNGVAFVCDIRSGALFNDLQRILEDLTAKGVQAKVIFLDAQNGSLINRYKELRRQHPLTQGGMSNEAAITKERETLEPLKQLASEVIDTTNLTSRQLTDSLRSLFTSGDKMSLLSVTLLSFGYKYGVPQDADFVFDSRFLTNPFYIEELKPLTGNDTEVYNFVMKDPLAQQFADAILQMVEFTLPGFEAINKINLLIAVGCTGGKHRSVSLVNRLKEGFEANGRHVLVIHRDIDRL